MEVKYRKDEVWLCQWATDIEPLTILEIAGGFVRHKYGWETAQVWHGRAKQKLGTVRRILGIKVGLTMMSNVKGQ